MFLNENLLSTTSCKSNLSYLMEKNKSVCAICELIECLCVTLNFGL